MRLLDKYIEERKKTEIEKYIVEALYQASSLAGYTSFENVIKALAESNYGALSKEFSRVYNAIRAGESVDVSLEQLMRRNNSTIFKRAISILLNGYKTGIDLPGALREVAEDAEKTLALERENRASATITKYTILLAGGVIVPIILGNMISLVSALDFSELSSFDIGTHNNKLLENAVLGNQIYVALYSVIASFFVAYQENRIQNSVVYLVFLLPTSVVLFNLVQFIKII